MNLIEINAPIWNGRKVGLAEDKLGKTLTEVKVLYKTKDGKPLYPNSFVIETETAKKYPSKTVRGTKLRIIPLAEMDKLYDI